MLNFSFETKGARVRGSGRRLYVQILNLSNGKYGDEMGFSSMSQVVSVLQLNDAVDYIELRTLRDIADEVVKSILNLT